MNNTLENSRLARSRNIEKVVTVDLGKSMAHYYDPSQNGNTIKITHKELLELPKKHKNTLFVSEIAHMDRPRNADSLAQPFLASELDYFKQNCENNNNLLRLFPERQTPEIRPEGEEKSDELDPIYLYNHITTNPSSIDLLKVPSKTYEPSPNRIEGWAIKDNVNKSLNNARRFGYGKDSDWRPREWLERNVDEIFQDLSDKTKKVLEISTYKKGNAKKNIQKGDVNVNSVNNAIYSVLFCLVDFSVDENMNVRYTARKRELTGELPGWKFIAEHVLGFSPCHMNGGIARSNLKFHNFRAFLNKEAEENGMKMIKKKLNGKLKQNFNTEEIAFFKRVQKEHKQAVKEMFFAIKKAMRNNPINEMQ